MKKIIILILLVLVAVGGFIAWQYYQRIYADNVTDRVERHVFFIPTGSTFDDVVALLQQEEVVKNVNTFIWVADEMNYARHVYPGRYVIANTLNNRELVSLLRSGAQTPLDLYLGKFRTKEQLAGHVSQILEADSVKILQLLNNPFFLEKHQLSTESVMAIFIPNKYEFYWTTNAEEFFERMMKEFERFWNQGRLSRLESHGLSRVEAITLASIVEEESQMQDERPIIAGVYLNRLRKNIRLQADPTVKFAMQDFELRRVLKAHTNYDSPYNTYRYAGLPPGPICTPSINAIEAVLNAPMHDYLYFCARDDFSGYHAFSKTYAGHLVNARKFQQALNSRKIYQ